MGFFQDFFGFEQKEALPGVNFSTSTLQRQPDAAVEQALWAQADGDRRFAISAVFACARVIAEGLALPPCYLHRSRSTGKTAAINHPLYNLLNAIPNSRQTSYEFREQIGYHLALYSNAYVYVTRSNVDEEVLELMPIDPGNVSVVADPSKIGAPIQYYVYGNLTPPKNIWHLKGPSWLSYEGMPIVNEARNAIMLASAGETYGRNLFTNGARPGGILSPQGPLTPDQAAQIREGWNAQAKGLANAHKTILLTAPIDYKAMAATANEAQWSESRRYQLEEICRYFRVSPTKVFSQTGSQSYASVEQAHIAHDADTDAHWQERFVQSANKALLSDKERRQGYCVTLDNRNALRGTAGERMAYYTAAIAAGIMTRNEARELEGFDPAPDAGANALTPAANLFGPKTPDAASTDEEPRNDG